MTSSQKRPFSHLLFALCLSLGLSFACSAPDAGLGMGESCQSDSQCSAGLRCVKIGEKASCQVSVESMSCEPGTAECDGKYLLRCADSGRDLIFESHCAKGCSDGECLGQTCEAGAVICDDNFVKRCSNDGLGWLPEERCETGCDPEAPMCLVGLCKAGSTRCLGTRTLETCKADGSGWEQESCLSSSEGASEGSESLGAGTCEAAAEAGGGARCVLPSCEAHTLRCEGDTLMRCEASGLSLSVAQDCEFGCDSGACLEAACVPGSTRCEGEAVYSCRPDGRAFEFLQHCSGSCAEGGSGAFCEPPLCAPLKGRCADLVPEHCAADGSGWEKGEACAANEVCVEGSCVPPPDSCREGEVRCSGKRLDRCERVGSELSWIPQSHCIDGCSEGRCTTPASCMPFELGVPLASEDLDEGRLPGDGISTFLVLSEVLRDSSGRPLPDGSLVSVGLESSAEASRAPLLLSTDASSDLPGLQVPVRHGRIRLLLQAAKPESGVLTGTLRAQLAGQPQCKGELELHFNQAHPRRWFAEDFSSTKNRHGDSAGVWDPKLRELRLEPFDLGDGRDGDLIVPEGSVVDLSTRIATCDLEDGEPRPCRQWADMASARILAVHENDTLELEGSVLPFAEAGTRVLLINLQGLGGEHSSTGAWELGTVEDVVDGKLRLNAPLSRHFGPGGNSRAQLVDQKVVIVRIPQYRKVQVSGTLTGPAFDGQQGGVLAFFAQSEARGAEGNFVSETGLITMSGKGYRGAQAPTTPELAWRGEGLGGGRNSPGITANLASSGGGYLCGDGEVEPVDTQLPPPGSTNEAWFGSAGSHVNSGASSCGGASAGFGSDTGRWLHLGAGSGSQSHSVYYDCPDWKECCLEYEGQMCIEHQECCYEPRSCCHEWESCCTEWNVGCLEREPCVNHFVSACRKRYTHPVHDPTRPNCHCEEYEAMVRQPSCGCEIWDSNDPEECVLYKECWDESTECLKYCGANCDAGNNEPCPCEEGMDGPHPCNNYKGSDPERPACCQELRPDACLDTMEVFDLCPENPVRWGLCPNGTYEDCFEYQRTCQYQDPGEPPVCGCQTPGPTPEAGCKTHEPSSTCVDGPASCVPGEHFPDEDFCGCDAYGQDASCECEEGGMVDDPATTCLDFRQAPACGCDPRVEIWANAYAGAPGGGLILIHAGAFELAEGQALSPRISASGAAPDPGGFGGAGGSVLLRVRHLELGGDHAIHAQGAKGGGKGRIWLWAEDFGAEFDSAWNHPEATQTQIPPLAARSSNPQAAAPQPFEKLKALVLPAAYFDSDSASNIDFSEAISATALRLKLSADGGASFAPVDGNGISLFETATPPFQGKHLDWKLELEPGAADGPGARVLGVGAMIVQGVPEGG